MATKADFSEQEWETLQKAITGTGLLVSLSDRDFTDSFGEARAMAKYLGEQHQQSTSTLVRDLAAIRHTGFGVRTSPQELETGTVDALHSALATLEAKAPDEVDAYKQLVINLADHVAEAKGGLSAEEQTAIDTIKAALG